MDSNWWKCSKESKGGPIGRKIIASTFWDAKRISLIAYLEKGKSATGEYHSNLLEQVNTQVCEKRLGLKKKNIIFHQDNAPVHKSVLAMGNLRDLRYDL